MPTPAYTWPRWDKVTWPYRTASDRTFSTFSYVLCFHHSPNVIIRSRFLIAPCLLDHSKQVGLALPFFIETAIIYPGTNASINSKGLFYAMILLFLSLVVTVYLFYMNQWILDKKLGIMMIVAYFVILLVSSESF